MRWIGGLGVGVAMAAIFAACGGSDNGSGATGAATGAGASATMPLGGGDSQGLGGSNAGDNGGGSGGASAGAGGDVDMPNPNAFFANDPAPAYCGPGDMPAPAVPGGTPDCPDDKNREGCACSTIGMKAACWPGLRKNRDLGICKDGMTTCAGQGEFGGHWGPCEGYVLPDPTATEGAEACQCFSAGVWKLANTSPCFVSDSSDSTKVYGALSSCGDSVSLPLTKPTQAWSKDTLKIDCAGQFKLCYTLKAGDGKAPSASDCTVAQVCTEGYYEKAGVEQAFPDLPGWYTENADEVACANTFVTKGGYGEMSVVGTSVTCDNIAQHVFNRVTYCPTSCNTTPTAPECKSCGDGASGSF